MTLFFEDSHEETEQAVNDPQPGDRFTEMYTFHLYVVERKGDYVTTIECGAPATLPDDGIIRTQSLECFKKRLSYGTIAGYWVRLVCRGADISWYTERKKGIRKAITESVVLSAVAP